MLNQIKAPITRNLLLVFSMNFCSCSEACKSAQIQGSSDEFSIYDYSNKRKYNEILRHMVHIGDVYVYTTEVQVDFYENFFLSEYGDNNPKNLVCHMEATEFCNTLNKLYAEHIPDRYEFRLLHSSEYKKLTVDLHHMTDEELSTYAWLSENSDSKFHPVAKKMRNYFGLFDVVGNLWEITQDKMIFGGSFYSKIGGNLEDFFVPDSVEDHYEATGFRFALAPKGRRIGGQALDETEKIVR